MSGSWLPLIAAALLLAGGISAADDWPRFRGPNGSGVSGSIGLPAEFGPAKNLLWKTTVPFSRSSPIIAGDRIFLTATEGEKLITICLDRSSGRIRWRREIVRQRVSPLYKSNDAASPSPVTDGKNIYAFFPDLGLVSFDAKGKERWRLPLGPFDTFYGMAGSPILSGDTLLQICDTRTKAFLVAVDATSGRIRWRVERSEIRFEGYASPVLWEPSASRTAAGSQPAQVIVLGANRLDAYSVATGEHLWWVRGLGSFPVGSPVAGNGVVLISTYGSDGPAGPSFEDWLKSDANGDSHLSRDEMKDFDEFGAVDRNSDGFIEREEWDLLRNSAIGDFGLMAVRPAGRGDLTQTGVAWRDKRAYNNISSMLVYKDVLYAAKSAGIIAALDPLTGAILKVGRPGEAPGEYFASPVAADDKVFFTSDSGKVVVLKAGRKWEVLAVNDLGEECYATPAIAAGRLFIRTRNALYSFGKK